MSLPDPDVTSVIVVTALIVAPAAVTVGTPPATTVDSLSGVSTHTKIWSPVWSPIAGAADADPEYEVPADETDSDSSSWDHVTAVPESGRTCTMQPCATFGLLPNVTSVVVVRPPPGMARHHTPSFVGPVESPADPPPPVTWSTWVHDPDAVIVAVLGFR